MLGLREFQDQKADIILKYDGDEARSLKTFGEVPDSVQVWRVGDVLSLRRWSQASGCANVTATHSAKVFCTRLWVVAASRASVHRSPARCERAPQLCKPRGHPPQPMDRAPIDACALIHRLSCILHIRSMPSTTWTARSLATTTLTSISKPRMRMSGMIAAATLPIPYECPLPDEEATAQGQAKKPS